MLLRKFCITVLLSVSAFVLHGQILTDAKSMSMANSIRDELCNSSFFKLYKNNYIAVGTSIKDHPDSHNSDAKFQVSASFRIVNKPLFWDTYLYFTYTQLTMWNIFEDSFPMRDLNFNPAIMLSKPLFHADRFIGMTSLIIEHESNGKDGDNSRSWNCISLCGNFMLTERLMVMGKAWIPIVDGENNSDLTDYRGFFKVGASFQPTERWNIFFSAQQRKGFMRFNTTAEVSWKISRKSNLWLFAQFYNGYGECLLDYSLKDTKLRAGVVFRPKFIFSTL